VKVSGKVLKQMMIDQGVTLEVLASRLGVTKKRVNDVLKKGLGSYLYYCDWHLAITGIDIYRSDQHDLLGGVK
jgi:transcriptional regulator with XRE-family HTH domain